MSLKAELQTWRDALTAYDAKDLTSALTLFRPIAESSRILFNMGVISATLSDHRKAIAYFNEATALDHFFAIAYHQAGVSNFLVARYDEALAKFEEALLYMRGNQTIHYEQLGLAFRLYSAEIYFNIGLTKINLGRMASGMEDLREAQREKQVPEHEVIDEAIRDSGRDYTVFSIPVGILFRPPASKLNNLETKDYMGKARLIAASDATDTYTTFTGITRLQRGQMPSGAPLDAGHVKRSASVSILEVSSQPLIAPLRANMSRSNTVTESTLSHRPSAGVLPLRLHAKGSARSPPSVPVQKAEEASLPYLAPQGPRLAPRVDPVLRPHSPQLVTPVENDRLKLLQVTELYDDYYASQDESGSELSSFRGESNALGLGMGLGDKSGTKRAMPAPTGSSNSSRSGKPPSSFGGIPVRRLISTRAAAGGAGLGRKPSGMLRSDFDGDDESVSDAENTRYEMTKIRVKIRVGDTTRGMAITPGMTHSSFMMALHSKFGSDDAAFRAAVRFTDEDGDVLEMHDASDFEAAVDVARANANGCPEGKLELWVNVH